MEIRKIELDWCLMPISTVFFWGFFLSYFFCSGQFHLQQKPDYPNKITDLIGVPEKTCLHTVVLRITMNSHYA